MTGHWFPGAVSKHPTQRVTVRMPSGRAVHLFYQRPADEALALAQAYADQFWAGARAIEATEDWT